MIYRIICKHDFIPLRNIYGDEINFVNARSEWICSKCQKRKYSGKLFTEADFLQSKRDIIIKKILDDTDS